MEVENIQNYREPQSLPHKGKEGLINGRINGLMEETTTIASFPEIHLSSYSIIQPLGYSPVIHKAMHLLARDSHALCVKISRIRQIVRMVICEFAGVFERNEVGTDAAKSFSGKG